MKYAGGDVCTMALFKMLNEVTRENEIAFTSRAGNVLICGMGLRPCQNVLSMGISGRAYLLAMSLPSTEALEVCTTELTCNMLEVFVQRLDTSSDSLEIRCHVLYFVVREVLPVLGIEVTLFAIEMVGIVFFVQFHCLRVVEEVLASLLGALKSLLLVWHAGCLASGAWVWGG